MPLSKRRSGCPISLSLDLLGDKWSLLIVRDIMFLQRCTYSDFLAAKEKIATNILNDRLQLLTSAKIVRRTKGAEDGRKVIYSLTEKGMDLMPALLALIEWGEKYHRGVSYPKHLIQAAVRVREARST